MSNRDNIPIVLSVLLAISRRLPPIKKASGISNRIIKPLWCKWHKESYVLPVWEGVRMLVDPCDCVGGNLAFIPNLYDRWERSVIRNLLQKGNVFVDVGSNIGAYALWAALHVSTSGIVLALEADKENYDDLIQNITLNGFQNIIQAFHVGVSDRRETLTLHRNLRGNKGGHSFLGNHTSGVHVECFPLLDLIKRAGIDKIDMMKIDIEGFENRVLTQYFQDVSHNSPLCPTYLLVEINGSPVSEKGKESLREMICLNGYQVLEEFDNALFRKSAVG